MKSLKVDLRTHRPPPRWAWAIAGILALFAIILIVFAWHQKLELVRVSSLRDSRLQELAATTVAPSVIPTVPDYYDSAKEMEALATSNWPSMLHAIQSNPVLGVTPTAIEISPTAHTILLKVDFSEYAQLLELLDALNAGEPKPAWSLIEARRADPLGLGSAATSTASILGIW